MAAISIEALGENTNEPDMHTSGLAAVAAAGSLLVTGTEYVALETVTGAFEGLLTGTSSGLPGIVGVIGVVGYIAIGSIISVSLVLVANFYLVLRRNNYRYRNAIVSVYEFYETLMRLGNMLRYLEDVSKTLEPPLKLDSDEIYQDIKNIFQVLDLITTSSAFKSVNTGLATGTPFNVPQQAQQAQQAQSIADLFSAMSRKAAGMVKGVTFNETEWLNKMNAAVARFNTHVIMLMSEWNIIASLRSKNTPDEQSERMQLPAFKCIIRHIVLAPIIRLRNIMYACALSTQSDLCQMHAKEDMVDNTIGSKIKRLWTKWVKTGGSADFNKLLALLKNELETIVTNPDYNITIEDHAKEHIRKLSDTVIATLSPTDNITEKQYTEIYEKVEHIYQYANACNTNGVVSKMSTITTNRRYITAAPGTAINTRVVGPDETKIIQDSILKYTEIHEKVTTVLISSGAAIIDPSNPLIIGAILLKIPYNHFHIPPSDKIEDSKYSAYLTQILVELNIIHSRASRNDAIIKAEPNIDSNVLTASTDALTAALKTKTDFETLKNDLDIEAAAAELNVVQGSRKKTLSFKSPPPQSAAATTATAAATKATAKAVATIKLQFGPLITEINLDQNTMKTLIGKLGTVSLPALPNVPKVDDIYIEDIVSYNRHIESILKLDIETRKHFYTPEFITCLEQIQIFFNFISHMIDQMRRPFDFRTNDFIIGIFVAKCLLFAFIINNDVIRFKTKDLLDTIIAGLNNLLSCKIHYGALYEHENQGNRIKIINFSKGFLCSIDEVRMIEKIKLLMIAEAQQQQRVECSPVTSQGYTSFNDALSLSQYGGSKKRKLFYSVKRKNKCVKSVKKSRTNRNGGSF